MEGIYTCVGAGESKKPLMTVSIFSDTLVAAIRGL